MTLYKTIATADGGCEHVPMSPAEEAEMRALWAEAEEEAQQRAAADVREKRNARLSESDWTQIADAPVNALAWAVYRQALRDIPAQSGFPDSVYWPIKPS